jgi:hypothetical protein
MTKSSYSALERGDGAEFIDIPSSESRAWPQRKIFAGAFMAIATVAILALAMHADPTPVTSAAVKRMALASQSSTHKSKLEGEEGDAAAEAAAVEDEFVPNLDKIHFPNTWASFQKTFGAHLTWAITILVLAGFTWIYVRFIRPQTWFKELLKKAKDSAKLPINVGDTLGQVPTEIDENDITGSLVLVPGEAVFFNEEAATKNVGTVYKLSVTNFRIIAQKAETTMFGTCQVGAREDAWPIENVSKVSVITGEFNGHSVSGLIHYCWGYFAVTMGFDLLQAFVLENIEDFLGNAVQEFPDLVNIVDTCISIFCNLLFLIAIVYAFAAMFLVIFPQSLVKVYLRREMEEEGNPVNGCSGCCCGASNSSPMETFTFKTSDSYRAYQAIMAARAGALTVKANQAGTLQQIPPGVFVKAVASAQAEADTQAPTTTDATKPSADKKA